MQVLFRCVIAAGLLCFVTGCKRSTPSENIEATAPRVEPKAAAVPRLTQDNYLFKHSVEAYTQVGRTNELWDSAVTNFIASRIGGTTRVTDKEAIKSAGDSMQAAEKAGCDDPLFRYMALRWRYDASYADVTTSNLWAEAAAALDGSDYPTYWKFYANMRAAQAVKSAIATSTNTPMVHLFRRAASQHLVELTRDTSAPAEIIFEAANGYINDALRAAHNIRNWTFEQVEPNFKRNWGDSAEYFCFIARYNIMHAWEARGIGLADTVSKEGWKLLGERLQVAREALERSWEIKPMEAAAVAMLSVELGDSRGRETMESWFKRAMKLNPASYQACEAKLNWLLPKWHGNATEVRAFGLECANSTEWKGNVPLILKEAHEHLSWEVTREDQTSREEYLARPAVWKDIQHSFERFFEKNPEAVGWRHDYAMAAYRASDWAVFLEQVKQFHGTNYAFFGGKEKFEEMVKHAEGKARGSKRGL